MAKNDPRILKLPVWAQEYIGSLENDNRRLNKLMGIGEAIKGKTLITLNAPGHNHDESFKLLENSRVSFMVHGRAITASIGKNHRNEQSLYISGEKGMLSVMPSATNCVYINSI